MYKALCDLRIMNYIGRYTICLENTQIYTLKIQTQKCIDIHAICFQSRYSVLKNMLKWTI